MVKVSIGRNRINTVIVSDRLCKGSQDNTPRPKTVKVALRSGDHNAFHRKIPCNILPLLKGKLRQVVKVCSERVHRAHYEM